jgi:hypothetical protein
MRRSETWPNTPPELDVGHSVTSIKECYCKRLNRAGNSPSPRFTYSGLLSGSLCFLELSQFPDGEYGDSF